MIKKYTYLPLLAKAQILQTLALGTTPHLRISNKPNNTITYRQTKN